MFEEAIGKTIIDPAIMGSLKEGVVPKAPGMKYKHYAPNADVTIVEGPHEKVVEYINSEIAEKEAEGHRCAVMATDETKEPIMLSSHMDGVGDDSPVNIFLDGDFIKAEGRTLGADDKVGVACALNLAKDLAGLTPPPTPPPSRGGGTMRAWRTRNYIHS